MTRMDRLPARLARGFVRALDRLLRRSYGVYEFTRDPDCILRFSLIRARADLALTDGTRIQRGDLLGVIHFWNERLPCMRAEGVDLRWAREMYRRLMPSLQLVARHVAAEPTLAPVRAICGEASFMRTSDLHAGTDLLSRLGFEVRPAWRGAGAWGRFATFWQNFYSLLLVWTFNPASLRGRGPWDLERFWLYMSRARLDERYGTPPPAAA